MKNNTLQNIFDQILDNDLYAFLLALTFGLYVGFMVMCGMQYLNNERELSNVTGKQFDQAIREKGYYPMFFGQCHNTTTSGLTYRVSCVSLFTEKELDEYRQTSWGRRQTR